MISERFKQIREHEKLSREKFAKRLGVSRGVIDNIEYNRVEAKDLYIQLVCKEFNINEDWLRTGKGEMFNPEDQEDRTIKLAADITKMSDEKTREAFEILRELEEPYLSIAMDMLLSLKKHSNE